MCIVKTHKVPSSSVAEPVEPVMFDHIITPYFEHITL